MFQLVVGVLLLNVELVDILILIHDLFHIFEQLGIFSHLTSHCVDYPNEKLGWIRILHIRCEVTLFHNVFVAFLGISVRAFEPKLATMVVIDTGAPKPENGLVQLQQLLHLLELHGLSG